MLKLQKTKKLLKFWRERMISFFLFPVCRSEVFYEDPRFYSEVLDTLTGLVLIPVFKISFLTQSKLNP